MPTILIKPERDRDLYVAWSTITRNPIAWGDRAQMLAWAEEDWQRRQRGKQPDLMSEPAGRLDRADIHGTSAAGGFAFFGRWDDDGFVYEQRGFLPRACLALACEKLAADQEAEVWDLLEPFDDETEVRRG